MRATLVAPEPPRMRGEEAYLGYTIHILNGLYVATPKGWQGEVLEADTLPVLRSKIWRWWHLV